MQTGAAAIRCSAPHIYLSALPFVSPSSEAFQSYKSSFKNILGFQNESARGQPHCLLSLHGHHGEVNSVAFSPDGTCIVSGSHDNTIRIWDAQNGQAVGIPLEGHSDMVFSVAFSPDGTHIVSGSSDKTIQIWDAQNGQAVGIPLEGHRGLALLEVPPPNDTYTVSGTSDNMFQIGDAHTGLQSTFGTSLGRNNHLQWFSPNGISIVCVYEPFHMLLTNSIPSGKCSALHLCSLELLTFVLVNHHMKFTPAQNDGWHCGPAGELLFWIPPDDRIGFYTPKMLKVISRRKPPLHLDFARFVAGHSWALCYTPLAS